jgi:hypothetical protein
MFKLSKEKTCELNGQIYKLFPDLCFKVIFVEDEKDHFGIMIEKNKEKVTIRNCDVNEGYDILKITGLGRLKVGSYQNVNTGNILYNPLLSQETILIISFYLENIMNNVGYNW